MLNEKILATPSKAQNALQGIQYSAFVKNIYQNEVILSRCVYDPFLKYDIIRSKTPLMLIKTLPVWSILSVICFFLNLRFLALLCIVCLACAYPLSRFLLKKYAWEAILGKNSCLSYEAREELYAQLVNNGLLYAQHWHEQGA